MRQYACKIFMQSDEKSDCASAAQSLCGVALIIVILIIFLLYSRHLYFATHQKIPAVTVGILTHFITHISQAYVFPTSYRMCGMRICSNI